MTELDGMLSGKGMASPPRLRDWSLHTTVVCHAGPRPIASVRLMNRLELLPVIFHLPPKMEVSLRAEVQHDGYALCVSCMFHSIALFIVGSRGAWPSVRPLKSRNSLPRTLPTA